MLTKSYKKRELLYIINPASPNVSILYNIDKINDGKK